MTENQFVDQVCEIAQQLHYPVEDSQNGRQLILQGKKLHEGHLRKLFPAILRSDARIRSRIEDVAPGRPCTHRPMREIIDEMHRQDADG